MGCGCNKKKESTTNKIVGKLKSLTTNIIVSKERSKERYDICKSCNEFDSTLSKCRVCGCYVPAKVKLESSKCDIGKW